MIKNAWKVSFNGVYLGERFYPGNMTEEEVKANLEADGYDVSRLTLTKQEEDSENGRGGIDQVSGERSGETTDTGEHSEITGNDAMPVIPA